MKYRGLFFVLMGFLFLSGLGAAGVSQSVSSEGEDVPSTELYITPPQDVWLNAYIAQADYHYPFPQTGPFNVVPITDVRDGTAYFMFGLKGKHENFGALPPMNLCFVIDTSVYMEGENKLEWVKAAFRSYINLVREKDIVSVVTFGGQADLLLPPTLIQTQADRELFTERIEYLEAGGDADMYQGMLLGYAEVDANYQGDYLNRVILLTGGTDNGGYYKEEFLRLNQAYTNQGIDISTLALGMDSDINLAADIAAAGGGAFRFIPDFEAMTSALGSELDRLVVPAVWKLDLELTFAPGVRFREAWGYDYRVVNNVFFAPLGTLHNGDSKTMIVLADLATPFLPGTLLGTLALVYTDTHGRTWRTESFPLSPGPGFSRNRGLSDIRLREAEGLIVLGKSLMDVGNRVAAIGQRGELYGAGENVYNYGGVYQDEPAGPQDRIAAELDSCLTIIQSTWDYLADISNNSEIDYARELRLLEDYESAVNQFYGDYLSY
ncbi:MAG: VWA domain-containing protein [Spirochaetaceae bacterium]|jgi:uncharacterized protein YegL|nr:VWA domain-containing protein [Spirochaetaceae bacterium]